MFNLCFCVGKVGAKTGRSLSPKLVALLAASATFVMGLAGAEGCPGASRDASAPRGASIGPAATDFNSRGVRISRVVRMERSLNALGIAERLRKSKKVTRHLELPAQLDPPESGEELIITWKYSGKSPLPKATVSFEYKLSEEEQIETITRDYPNLDRGSYRLRVVNTGQTYRRRGRIDLWRVSIFADGQLAARKESFLWPVFGSEEEGGTVEQGGSRQQSVF